MFDICECPMDPATLDDLAKQREFIIKKLQERPLRGLAIWLAAGILAATVTFYFWRSYCALAIPIFLAIIKAGRHIDALSNRRNLRMWLSLVEKELATPTVKVMHVAADEFWEFEEVEDEGAAYIFRIGETKWLFIHGQDFYPQKGFPSHEFRIVMGMDDSLLRIEGVARRCKPSRVLSGNSKNGLFSPYSFYAVADASEEAVIQALRDQTDAECRQRTQA